MKKRMISISACSKNPPNALKAGDPEVNLNMLGRYITQSSRVYLNSDQEIVFQIQKEEFVYNPKGEKTESREPRHLEANINVEKPLMWSGKSMPIKEIYKKFALIRKYQLMHTNGLTFDMLYDIAKELHESQSMMLIGSGKGTGPVIFQEGGTPFRVFLEGLGHPIPPTGLPRRTPSETISPLIRSPSNTS